jgi:hypothetical protein
LKVAGIGQLEWRFSATVAEICGGGDKVKPEEPQYTSEDVKILLEMDLIEMEKHGKNKAPRLHYNGFRLEVAL